MITNYYDNNIYGNKNYDDNDDKSHSKTKVKIVIKEIQQIN